MKITNKKLRQLIAEGLSKSKEFKKLNEKFYPSNVRKLNKGEDPTKKTSHEAEGFIEPTIFPDEFDPEVYPFADPSHPEHDAMKKRFRDDPSAMSDYRRPAKLRTMFYKDSKSGRKTHRPKLSASDLEGIEGLRYPESDSMSAQKINTELGSQSRGEFAPFDEGGESFSDDISTARAPSKRERKAEASNKLESLMINIQEKIVTLEEEPGNEDRIAYLQSLYEDIQMILEEIDSINI
jgi:hypothetical protein